MIDQNYVTNYMQKLKDIEEQQGKSTDAHILSSKIEAHLEMLCLLGLQDIMEKMERKKK